VEEGLVPQQDSVRTTDEKQHKDKSRQGKHRRARIRKNNRAAQVRNVASAVVAKEEDLFFLCDQNGRVPLGGKHGLGLYYHDCRFLNGYELTLAGARPSLLVASCRKGFQAEIELTNSEIRTTEGAIIQKEDVGIHWDRIIDASRHALYDEIIFHNYKLLPVEFPIALSFGSGFEDLFTVRGMPAKSRGTLYPPTWQDGALTFAYDGADGIRRHLAVHFFPAPETTEEATAHFRVSLGARGEQQFRIALVLAENALKDGPKTTERPEPDLARVAAAMHHSATKWLESQTAIHTDSQAVNRVLDRSLRDLRVLRSRLKGHYFFAAGVPWYVTLFGRDSLISALQTLAYEPEIAEHTLRLLATYQGTEVNAWRDEEPGKIMHELRLGEFAHLNEIPQTPYYGTIDATPLFLILICRHAAWTGSLALFQSLRSPIEDALDWMAKYGDPTGEGYLAYEVKSKKGLSNQGWKDSGDAIMNADGSLARPPIALAEVQGYVYMAKLGLADLYERAGEGGRAEQLRSEAVDLRQRFNRDFWLEDKGIYALALQKDRRPCAVVASNAGQVLWSGIAKPDKARQTMERLMTDDMFSGWGIRTLSHRERRYNPIGYHLGTVWPHDNSLIVAGFRHYGFDEAAGRIFAGILEAATMFHADRLPEVFAGFRREAFGVPVHYPVACHPQAWAAGAVPYMVQTLLGLVPEAFDRRLRIVRPALPAGVNQLEVQGLRMGDSRVGLRFRRAADRKTEVDVLKNEGHVDVDVS
jgi:glycogen debranching enzyme